MAQQLDADDDDHDHAVVVFGGGDRVGSSRGSSRGSIVGIDKIFLS